MNKQEFIAASLPYNPAFSSARGKIAYASLRGYYIPNIKSPFGNTIGKEISLDSLMRDFKPIIRPLDSLTKECIQADYNDGKPFIPIVELARYLYDGISWTGNYTLNENHVHFDSYESYNEFWYSVEHRCFMTLMNDEDIPVHNQLQLFQQLLKWHFWPNMPEGEEVVYVSDNFNPYK